jgi:flagellar hook-basal body complex protein FliE
MSIQGITSGITPISPGMPQAPKVGGSDGSFGSVVRGAVESLERNQQQAEQATAQAVAGESPDLHRTVIALQTAELSFQLGLQVRNKVIGAYEEIMRMQV